jgi:histidinol phosphatase-like PHP family hydrolase
MVLFKDIFAIDNGAQFHNVDLHIHSYGATHDVTDETMTPENIIESAVRQGLIIIAITDHNSNLNVQRAIDYAQDKFVGQILGGCPRMAQGNFSVRRSAL